MMNHEYESLNNEMDLKASENENLRNELKNLMDNFRQLESESRQIQSELRSQLKMAEVDSKNLQSQLNEKEILLSGIFKILEDFYSKFLKLKSDSESEIKSLKDKSEEYRNELETKKLERIEELNIEQIQAELDELKQTIEEIITKIDTEQKKEQETQIQQYQAQVASKKPLKRHSYLMAVDCQLPKYKKSKPENPMD